MTVAQPSSSTRSPRLRLALPHAVPMPGFSSPQPPVVVRPSAPLSSRPFKTATLTTFRINTCKSVSKQRTLTPFRINTYKKQGRGVPQHVRATIPGTPISRLAFASAVICATWRLYPLCPHSIAHTSRRHGDVGWSAPVFTTYTVASRSTAYSSMIVIPL